MVRRLGSIANRRVEGAGVGVRDKTDIGKKDHVEFAALADLGDMLV
jgi:hypothetical protein